MPATTPVSNPPAAVFNIGRVGGFETETRNMIAMQQQPDQQIVDQLRASLESMRRKIAEARETIGDLQKRRGLGRMW